jgi:hypothetical protein
MFEPITRVVVATLVAGTVALVIAIAPAAKGHEPMRVQEAKQAQISARSDQLRVPLRGSACSLHGWPNFERQCQFDLREPASAARTVRVIALR